MGEQTGGAVIGVLLEGEMDLRFELGEGRGIASELLRPVFLPLREGSLKILKGLLQGRNLCPAFATQAKLHGRPLARSRLLDTLPILLAKGFLGFTFRDCTRPKPCTSSWRG